MAAEQGRPGAAPSDRQAQPEDRRRSADGATAETLSFVIPGELAAVSGARRRVDGWLEGWGASAAVRQDAALVVSELCTNAVEAAPRHRIGVHVRFDGDGDQILLAVENPGSIDAIPDPGAWRPTSPSATGGRGLMIVAALADRVEVEARRGESERVMVRAVLPAHSRR